MKFNVLYPAIYLPEDIDFSETDAKFEVAFRDAFDFFWTQNVITFNEHFISVARKFGKTIFCKKLIQHFVQMGYFDTPNSQILYMGSSELDNAYLKQRIKSYYNIDIITSIRFDENQWRGKRVDNLLILKDSNKNELNVVHLNYVLFDTKYMIIHLD